MRTIKQWIIDRRLNRVFIMLVAGMLVFLNVACSKPNTISSGGERVSFDNGVAQRGMSDTYNGFPDNDPKIQAKVRSLVNTAKKNAKNPKGFADSVKTAGERASNLPKDLSRQAERQKDSLVKATKEDARNLKNNLEKASNEVPKIVEEAKGNAQKGLESSLKSAEETVDMLKTNVQETIR